MLVPPDPLRTAACPRRNCSAVAEFIDTFNLPGSGARMARLRCVMKHYSVVHVWRVTLDNAEEPAR